jgi:hypothetical protein
MTWKVAVETYFKELLRHSSGGNEEHPKHLGHDIRCPDRDRNQAPPQYKSAALPLEPTRSVSLVLFTLHNERIKSVLGNSESNKKQEENIPGKGTHCEGHRTTLSLCTFENAR